MKHETPEQPRCGLPQSGPERWGCRIGRVRLRSGAEVRVIERGKQRPAEAVKFAADIVEHAAVVAREWPKLAGYAIVAWDADSQSTTAYGVGEASPVSTVAMPRFAADCLRQASTVNGAVDWINKQMG